MWQISRPYSPDPFYGDVINIYSLCYAWQMHNTRDGPSFIKFLKLVYSWLYYWYSWNFQHFLVQLFPPDFSVRVLWTSCSYLFIYLFFWCFFCCLSFSCGHTYLLSVLRNSVFFLSPFIGLRYRLCLH